MKNRSKVLCGMAMLFVFFTTLTSCKKEELTNEDNITSADSEASLSDINGATTVGALSAYVRKNLLFNISAEPADALTYASCLSSSYWCSIQKYASYSIQRSSTVKRSGSYSSRYELRKTDGDVAGSKRAETNRSTKCEPVVKCERWYGISFYLPSDYATDPAAEILTQWQTISGSHPPLALWTINGQWRIVPFGDLNQGKIIGNYEKSKWTDFVFHVKWSTGTDGLTEVWKDGVKVFSKTGANIYTGLTYGAYMKAGIYKWPWKSTQAAASTTTKRIVYIDDIRVGSALATYSDVAPGP